MKTINVELGAGGRKNQARLVVPEGDKELKPGALFIHGWGSEQNLINQAAQKLAERGFICLSFDLRGHGKTGDLYEKVSPRENLSDTVEAYDFLAMQEGLDASRIGVVGYSYGGYMAVLLTQVRQVEWLALRSPALYRDSYFDIPKFSINRTGLNRFRNQALGPEDSRALAAASIFKGKVLMIEAEKDVMIPHQQILNYVDAFSQSQDIEYQIIVGADHAYQQKNSFDKYLEILTDWIEKQSP